MDLANLITDLKFASVASLMHYLTTHHCEYVLNQETHRATVTFPGGYTREYYLLEENGRATLCYI